jgi:hypothetical protein
LIKFSGKEILSLHGVGTKPIPLQRKELADAGLDFASL